MKRFVIICSAAVLWLISSAASADIATSAHDLRTPLGITDICVVCHAPHENQNGVNELLWNRGATGTSFTPYSSPTLDGTAGAPSGVSLLCLGCHDGTIGVDAYGGAAGTAANQIGGTNFASSPVFGPALNQDHPIAITYEPASDSELNALTDPAVFVSGPAGTVDDLVFGTGAETQTVECGSCHDVHNTRSQGGTSLLVISNTNSALCLTCHNK